MTYWEPIATPSSHLEPPEPEEEICDACERDMDVCDCGECDSCGNTGLTEQVESGDETLWLCENCRQDADEPASATLVITIDLVGDAFAERPCEEVYRILNDYAGLIGFVGELEERPLLDVNGNAVGRAALTRRAES